MVVCSIIPDPADAWPLYPDYRLSRFVIRVIGVHVGGEAGGARAPLIIW